MLRYQHSVNNSSRQGRQGSTPAAIRPPAVAHIKPLQQALRHVLSSRGSSSCSGPTVVLHPAVVSAARSALMFDSDDYEWEEYGMQLNNDTTSAAASGMTAAAGATLSAGAHSSVSSKAASAQSRQPQACKLNQQHHKVVQAQQQEAASAEYSFAGGGIVGVFVAGWMALIGLVLRLLQPVMSLALLLTQPLTNVSPAQAKHQLQKLAAELPEGFWAKLHFLWELPVVKSIRITLSVANWGVRLPAIAALLLTQGSLLASQVSLPMLAPLLLGTGMMMNSIKKNASFIFPRVGLLVVLLWLLWFFNSVIQNTWLVLRNQGRIDARTMSGARMMTECSSLLLAGILVLSALGININALLLPTGVVLAIASKDLLQNLIAGFYLVLVQPFRLGDKVAVSCSLPSSAALGASSRPGSGGLAAAAGAGSSSSSSGAGALGAMQGWFEGVCEKVDLRYTVLRDGRRRLMVPNTAFVSREFLVYDEVPADLARPGSPTSSAAHSRSSSPWPGGSTSSTGSAYPEAEFPSREHIIREGHMTTELPPLAPPIFPGMTLVGPPPGYGQLPYAPQGYAAVPYPAGYSPMQQMQEQQQVEQEGRGPFEQDRQEQQDMQGAGAAAADGRDRKNGQVQLQQDGSSSSSSSSSDAKGSRPKVAKGPPGYLPQGYTAGQYLGIPVYWTLPGMLGPWTGQQQQQQAQQQQQQQQQQQYFEQQHYDHFEPAGMHQPVPTHYPPTAQSQQQPVQEPWQQQAQQHWQQQQAQQHWQQQQAQQHWQQQQAQQHWQQQQQRQRRVASQQAGGSSVPQGQSDAVPKHPSCNSNGSSGNDSGSRGNSSRIGAKSRPNSQGSNDSGNGSSNSSSSRNPVGNSGTTHPPDVRGQQQHPEYHQNAMHFAALGAGGYTSFLGGAPPGSLLQQVHPYTAAQLQYMPVQHYQTPTGHMQQQLPTFGQDNLCAQQQQSSSGSPGASAAAGPPDASPAGARASPVDLLEAGNGIEPATAAANAGLSMQSLHSITGGVTAAASAAAVAGSAAGSEQAQQFGTLAAEAAGHMWGPVVGMLEEIGQGLNEL